MASKSANELATAILDDRKGAGYYNDPKILADFLKGHFASPTAHETVASVIVQDFNGAGYYKDPVVLAQFLEGQMRAQ